MAQNNFSTCLSDTLIEEGGYSNDPRDPGGATMKGITQAVYDAWRVAQGKPKQPVKQITDAEVETIYHDQYWAQVRGDDCPAGVDLSTFDYGVNSGPVTSIKALQAAIGVTVDGHFGMITADALTAADPATVIKKIADERSSFLHGLSNFKTFGPGWITRNARIEAEALKMVDPTQLAQHAAATKSSANLSAGNVAFAAGAGVLSLFSGIPTPVIVGFCVIAGVFALYELWNVFHKNVRATTIAVAGITIKPSVPAAPAPKPVLASTASAVPASIIVAPTPLPTPPVQPITTISSTAPAAPQGT